MAKRLLIILFLSVLSALRCMSQVINSDDKIRQIVSRDGQVEVTLPYTDRTTVEILTSGFSILSVKDKVVHVSLSPLTVESFILQKYDYKIIDKADNKGVISALNLNEAMQWDKYPTYTQYDSIMHSFLILYPSLCRLDTIGTSVNGKLVLALKISDNALVNEDEPEVFYSSSMHGDETGGFVLMLRLADYLLKNYSLDNRVKNLVDNLEIWINPLANPDGTYRSGNTISDPIRYNANGYDLNRNFPDPITPNTIRQKETIDMIKFMRKHRFVLSANFHSGSEVVNYPWDRWISKYHADNYWFRLISRAYADTVHIYSGPAYMSFLDNGITRGADWYLVYGGRQDFITYELHGREVTIELDDQYITPAVQLPLLWQNNWHSLLGYLENALYGIHGQVRNVNSHVPVPARVFIESHDKDSSHVYSDTITGSFVRLLSPGTWTLTFSAKGYWPATVSNITVASGQKTDIIVDMSPILNSIENTNSSTPIQLYPNPATQVIKALLPDLSVGEFNIMIINQAGRLLSDYNTEVFQGIPLLIDVKSLSPGSYTVLFSNTVAGAYYYGRFIVIK
jgi:Zinc carboxypeptidase/Carboxypeptidase regulatory-like domain